MHNLKEILYFSCHFPWSFVPRIDIFKIRLSFLNELRLRNLKRRRRQSLLNNIYIFINSLEVVFRSVPSFPKIVCVYLNAIVCLFRSSKLFRSPTLQAFQYAFVVDRKTEEKIIDWEMKNKWAEKYIKRIQISTIPHRLSARLHSALPFDMFSPSSSLFHANICIVL